MRKKESLISAIFGLMITTYCTNNNVIVTVGIEKIDTNGVYFSYQHIGEMHSAILPLDLFDENFYSTDSLKIKINKNKPEEFVFVSIVRRNWPKEESYITIDSLREKQSQYHSIDKKPLFKGANDYESSDSLVQVFLKKELLRAQSTIPDRIGLYLIIDQGGKASLGKVYDSDPETENILRDVVETMPLFKPGEHQGKKVKVSYLVEITK